MPFISQVTHNNEIKGLNISTTATLNRSTENVVHRTGCSTVCQGSHASLKVLDFFVNFPGPGKSWKMALVLEILVKGPGFFFRAGHNCVGADAKMRQCAHLLTILPLSQYSVTFTLCTSLLHSTSGYFAFVYFCLARVFAGTIDSID